MVSYNCRLRLLQTAYLVTRFLSVFTEDFQIRGRSEVFLVSPQKKRDSVVQVCYLLRRSKQQSSGRKIQQYLLQLADHLEPDHPLHF
jgi:hypothetical protein